MSAAFTPGPWQAFSSVSRERPIVIDTAALVDSTNDTIIAEVQRGKQGEANARLIAAAPELYAALDALLEAAERHIFGDECLSQRNAARAVLRQARGEQ